MKKLILLSFASIIFVSCKQKNEENLTINGVYKMDSQSAYSVDTDSLLLTSENPNQIKMYSDSHFIWVNFGSDSVGNFGIGTYVLEPNKISETSIFTSSGNENPDIFTVNFEKTENGYNQNINPMDYNGTPIKLAETYSLISNSTPSEFDGLWKATQNYFVNGSDTIQRNYPDYKMYNNGHFAWAIRALMDTTNNIFGTYVGSGTFSVDGNVIKELTSMSNINSLGSSEEVLNIINKNSDEFIQSINQKDGSTRYTVYSKVK